AEWRATAADQLLALTCCWPELEEPAQPPAWPLALLPLGLYPLWWIAKPRRGLRAVRAGDAGRVATRPRAPRSFGNWGGARTAKRHSRQRTPVVPPPTQHRPR